MPSIGIACGTFQCGLAVAGNPDGRSRSLDGFGSKISISHVVVLSLEGNGIRPPECLEEFKTKSFVQKLLGMGDVAGL